MHISILSVQKILSLLAAMTQDIQEERHYGFSNTEIIRKREKNNYFSAELL